MGLENYPVYRHSGKFTPHGFILAVLLSILAAWLLGFVYYYTMRWMPLIYFKVFVTFGYGFIAGLVCGVLLKYFKVRNNSIALLSGSIVGLAAAYASWTWHVHSLVNGGPLLATPDQIQAVMKVLYEEGSWSVRGVVAKGGILATVWVCEAFFVVAGSALTSYATISSQPFCELHECWFNKEKTIDTIEAFSDPALITALQAGDLRTLSNIKGKVAGAPAYGRLHMHYSDKSDEFCTLTIYNVSLTPVKDNKPRETPHKIVGNLRLPKAMVSFINRFEHIKAGVTLETQP